MRVRDSVSQRPHESTRASASELRCESPSASKRSEARARRPPTEGFRPPRRTATVVPRARERALASYGARIRARASEAKQGRGVHQQKVSGPRAALPPSSREHESERQRATVRESEREQAKRSKREASPSNVAGAPSPGASGPRVLPFAAQRFTRSLRSLGGGDAWLGIEAGSSLGPYRHNRATATPPVKRRPTSPPSQRPKRPQATRPRPPTNASARAHAAPPTTPPRVRTKPSKP